MAGMNGGSPMPLLSQQDNQNCHITQSQMEPQEYSKQQIISQPMDLNQKNYGSQYNTQFPQNELPKPPPPIVGKVTHHSIELYWDEAVQHAYSVTTKAEGKIKSCIQEKDKFGQWSSIYTGYGSKHTVQDCETQTQYSFRLRFMNDVETSEWSPHTIVSTTKEPLSAEQLHKAVTRGYHEVAMKILESGEVDIDVPDNYGFTPLMTASKRGDDQMVELLIKYGADVNLKNESGKTALMFAAFAKQLGAVKLLRKGGAKYDIFDRGGSTAVHMAVDGGSLEMLEWMIADGADPDVSDHGSGWTPLLRCATVNAPYMLASCLLREGASINKQDNDGKTALMIAIINKNKDLVDLLLQRRADVTVINKYGKNAYDMAVAMDKKSVTQTIERHLEKHDIKGVKKI